MLERQLFVLIACEESQAECEAFRRLGHIAYSCDLQPCRKAGHPEWHIKGDCLPYLHGKFDFTTQSGSHVVVPGWDLIICHPPCTYLCKISAVQLHKDASRYIEFKGKGLYVNSERLDDLYKGRDFFFLCLNALAPHVAVENPAPLALAQLPPPSAFACPSWFGSKYSKKTYYWLKALPPLMPAIINSNPKCFVRCSRGKYRSRTSPCLADAIAVQWSSYIVNNYNSTDTY